MSEIPDELYERILRSMPIPCVDALVVDSSDRVLLLQRKNEPARGEWWFPGGRVLHFESRTDAVTRKIREECGLTPQEVREVGTYEIFFHSVHSITTMFEVRASSDEPLTLDEQSSAAEWRTPQAWLETTLPPFVRDRLEENLK